MTALLPSQTVAPFAPIIEPSDFAYELAAEVEHLLLVAGITDLPLKSMARVIEAKVAARNREYVAMETALAAAVQTAQIHGASAEEMRRINELMNTGAV